MKRKNVIVLCLIFLIALLLMRTNEYVELLIAELYGSIDQDVQAVKWYKKSAQQGNAIAQYKLGWAYGLGLGTDENKEKSFAYYLISAQQGYTRAEVSVALRYKGGIGIAENDLEARIWFLKAAKKGNLLAQFQVAQSYYYGEKTHIKPDYEEAFKWYKLVAEHEYDKQLLYHNGYLWSKLKVAYMYENGKGVDQSYDNARYWYLKASDNPLAQLSLGRIYEKGLGVEVDMDHALQWYQKITKIKQSQYYREAQAGINRIKKFKGQ